jgi:hypothetical protein
MVQLKPTKFCRTPTVAEWSLLEVSLWQFSESKPHPQAQVHTLELHEFKSAPPGASIEIVGDNLVIVASYALRRTPAKDHVYFFDWKTGKLKHVRLTYFRT